MQDVSDPVLPPSSGGADVSQGALDAAAALSMASQEDASPAPADLATQSTDTGLSSLPAPTADGFLSGPSLSEEPVDILAAPCQDEVPETAAASAPASPDLDMDMLDVLGASKLMTPLEA